MKQFVCCILLLLAGFFVRAQKQNFDIVSYTAPRNWNMEAGENFKMYSRIDGGSWAQIAIYRSAVSKGDIEADSKSEWETIVTSSHTVSQEEKAEKPSVNGWHVMSRSGVWIYNGANVATILTTYSNGKVCVSVLCNATALPYLKDYQKLMAKLSLNAGKINNSGSVSGKTKADNSKLSDAHIQAIGQLSTRWDDGWVSSIRESWTEVAKPLVRIFVFHPDPQSDAYNSDKAKGDRNAWDILVAPHFSNSSSLLDRGMQSYPAITFLTADATEKKSGKKVHLVLYKKHYDQGNGRYMLVVADSKAAFEKEFGNNYINTSSWETLEQSKSWDKLAEMQWRNRFSLSMPLLTGKWTSGNSSTLSYYYVSTGGHAGATAVSVADAFTFLPGNHYESDHAGASGVVGNQQFTRQQYKGNFVLKGWKVQLTNRFRGKTEEYDGYFEAVKGGLILVLIDNLNTTKALVREAGGPEKR